MLTPSAVLYSIILVIIILLLISTGVTDIDTCSYLRNTALVLFGSSIGIAVGVHMMPGIGSY